MTNSFWEILAKYLTGEATESEQQQVTEWLQQDTDNVALLERLTQYLKKGQNVYHDFAQYKVEDWEKLQARIQARPGVVKMFNLYYRVAAAVTLIAICAAGYWLIQRHNTPLMVVSAGESTQEIRLPDSSVVVLNKNSVLTVHSRFGRKNREVTLQGEAFFEVKKNETLPFEVHSQEITTRVLGTAFNIEATVPDKVVVSVEHGKVQVASQDEAVIITDQMSAEYAPHEKLKVHAADINYLSWKTGIIRFENKPLSEVLSFLSQHYETSIRIDKSVSPQTKITVELDNLQVDRVLEIISFTLDLAVERNKEGYLLTDSEK